MTKERVRQRVFVVGFTGHRHLEDPVAVGKIIRAELALLQEKQGGLIAGYTSVAIGADTLFAEACLTLNIPWTAALPFSPDEFRDDFSAAEWSCASDLLKRALEVEICGTADDRTAAYLRCGLRTVDQSDLVMAVWDGKPARGEGGTGEVVAYARKQKKPLILIHPVRKEITRELLDK